MPRQPISSMSASQKIYEAESIFASLGKRFPHENLLSRCGYDFKTCSMVAYMLAAELYAAESGRAHAPEDIRNWLELSPDYDYHAPLIGPLFLPVRYCGNIKWERIVAFNRCAFSSSDSIIGIKNADSNFPLPCELYTVLKGLTKIEDIKGMTLFKLDPATTDDMTAMLALHLEKNFTLEIAHLPHDASPRILFRWEDS